jgi:2-polyprenyl-3-methyl-5-hydroxy-6-metoxy-1,4-benzoquinol methylase
MDIKEIEILSEGMPITGIVNHWYYQSKAAATLKLIKNYDPSVIFDVGAGSGYFSRYMLRHTSAREAWCVDVCYPGSSDSDEEGKPVRCRKEVDFVNADLVLIMDVLEHIDDDSEFLKNYVSRVPQGAKFLISVPAFQFLWSGHDVFLEHKRRYTLPQLEALVSRTGLVIEKSNYYFGFVFPAALVTRLADKIVHRKTEQKKSQLKKLSHFVNKILSMICRAELPIMGCNKCIGLTVFCVAKKL